LDPNQGEEALLQEARSQKRKAANMESRDDELDREINNLEAIRRQVMKQKKMLRLSKLQKKIDDTNEQMCNIA
jgi:predicted RNase H-like nuclease (RuvC/YqgF family)